VLPWNPAEIIKTLKEKPLRHKVTSKSVIPAKQESRIS
jgi:hypothetical protein